MKAYSVTVPYWYTLTAIVHANNEEEALEAFDNIPTDACREDYQGLLDNFDIEVRELP